MSRLASALAKAQARFRGRAASDAAALRGAVADGRSDDLKGVAHRLAGTAGLFGFPAIGTLATSLEIAARNPATTHPAVTQAANELAEALERLAMETETE